MIRTPYQMDKFSYPINDFRLPTQCTISTMKFEGIFENRTNRQMVYSEAILFGFMEKNCCLGRQIITETAVLFLYESIR